MRTEYCGQLNLSHVGQQVTLCGWVNRRRDLGSLIFIDMRDREGIVQVFLIPIARTHLSWLLNCVTNSVSRSPVPCVRVMRRTKTATWRPVKWKCLPRH